MLPIASRSPCPVGVLYVEGYAVPGGVVQLAFFTQGLSGAILTVEADKSDLFPDGEKFYVSDESYGFGEFIKIEKGWGSVWASFSHDPRNPLRHVNIPVPPQTPHGRLDLPLRVHYLVADKTENGGDFREKSGDVVVSVPITVCPPDRLKWLKLRDVAGRFGVILVATVCLMLAVGSILLRTQSNGPMIAVGIVYLIVTIVWGSHPLAAILGVVHPGGRLFLFLVEVFVVGMMMYFGSQVLPTVKSSNGSAKGE